MLGGDRERGRLGIYRFYLFICACKPRRLCIRHLYSAYACPATHTDGKLELQQDTSGPSIYCPKGSHRAYSNRVIAHVDDTTTLHLIENSRHSTSLEDRSRDLFFYPSHIHTTNTSTPQIYTTTLQIQHDSIRRPAPPSQLYASVPPVYLRTQRLR